MISIFYMKELCKPFRFFHVLLWANLGEIPGRPMAVSISSRKGFTLIELIAAMVLVGVATAVAGVSFMSFTRTGSNKETLQYTEANEELAVLAQHRLELILKEKNEGNGFPDKGDCDGVKDSQCGPDPCLFDKDLQKQDVCSGGQVKVDVEFTNLNEKKEKLDGCWTGQTSGYCEVKVAVDNKQSYLMRLYDY
jgi:prepilin-type N-terminal cleavage/methylation domain-containing protein